MQVRSHRVRRTATKVKTRHNWRVSLPLIAVLMGLGGQVAVEPASASIESQRFGFTQGALAGIQAGVDPHICNPIPPDYPGCTVKQTRPQTQYQLRRQYTGHATGYRWHDWGQHHRGEVFSFGGGLTNGQNTHLRNLYYKAVKRWQNQHATVGPNGEVVLPQPMYPSWLGFRDNVSSGCTQGTIGPAHFPNFFCKVTTGFSWFGDRTTDLTKLVLQCDGTLVAGLVTGQLSAKAGLLKLGTGTLKGGWYGIAVGEVACQADALTDWVQKSWGLS